jgi:hypothetical protein
LACLRRCSSDGRCGSSGTANLLSARVRVGGPRSVVTSAAATGGMVPSPRTGCAR